MATIYDPIRIGPLEARNRFHHRPMWSGSADPWGFILPRTVEMYRRIARGGHGLVTVQVACVHKSSYVAPNHIAVFEDAYIPGLWELARAIKMEGAKAGIQLFYAGSLSNPRWQIHVPKSERFVPAPSDAPADWSYHGKPTRALTAEGVEEAIESFAQGAARVAEAEFDYVMIHATHGSLPMQFLSPRWNRREDEYGADRSLFLRKIIRAVRRTIPAGTALSVNVSAHEAAAASEAPRGYDETYLYDSIVPMLLEEGVDWIEITAGTIAHPWGQAWLLVPIYFEQATFFRYSREVKKRYPDAVVGAAGKVMDPRLAERLVADGSADIVGLGRPAWADPDYPRKAMAGAHEDVRQCTSCGFCVSFFYLAKRCFCAVNPAFHRESDGWEALPPAAERKRVLVIGGGPGGMECARVAHLRGHDVLLQERKDRLGGLVNLAGDIPYVETIDLQHIVTWHRNQLDKLGVETRLGAEVGAETVESLAPDVVVVATGSRPLVPALPGIDLPHVMMVDRYLEEKPPLKGRAVVLGGWEGAETALSLARQGLRTVLVSETAGIFGARYFWGLFDRRVTLQRALTQAGVELILGATVREIDDRGVLVIVAGREIRLPADVVVVGFGREPVSELAASCRGLVKEVYTIGDAVEPRSKAEAIEDGYRVGRLL
jgi:2,4-dienoyl-CoA reductase-like NADH-dependent reductase (Old Yellow Enzyme family)/NADPH-dependent 2,4-dienoyl-CoA reductase/sulfur reductase-like enzyme